MLGIVGICVIFIMVFGGYLLAGGKLGIIVAALPFELMMIGGAAVGAFLISNDMHVVKQTGKDLAKVFKGPKWQPKDYRDLLCLMFELIRLARSNPVALEEHIQAHRSTDNVSFVSKVPENCCRSGKRGPDLRHASRGSDELRRSQPG